MGYTGVYDRTIYYNPVSKYCVISVKTADESIPKQARSAYTHRDHLIRFTAVGYELPQTDKISMILNGEWQDGKYGQQLQVEQYEEIVPQTIEGIKGYLSSRLIKGVGEKTANLIIERFGVDSLNVIENTPERLLEIKGITDSKLESIKTSYTESRCLRDLMILLSPFNITPTSATKIYEYFGARSVDILRDNPYQLCKISGFGFKRVDAIVRKSDSPLNSPMRIQGGIYAVLDNQRNEKGHLFLEAKKLLTEALNLLNDKISVENMCVKQDEIADVLENMILRGEVVSNKENIYQTRCFVQEDETAHKIAEILSAKPEDINTETILSDIRKDLGIALSQRQSEAVFMAFRSNLSIITGSPGTGKTTVLKAIIEVFKKIHPNEKIMLAAPTGRASRRMAESTGMDEAKTLHSLLGLLGDSVFIPEKDKQLLDANLIIVDESSMIDMWLAQQFFQRIKIGTKIVLVGDVDQLQSVGAGDVFRELINCGKIPVTILDEIFRQKKDSLIAYNAKSINENNIDLNYGNDFMFFKCKTQEEAAEIICNTFCEQVEKYGVEHVQILSPYRSEGLAAVEQLNVCIREIVNPGDEDIPDLRIGNRFFRENDKIMQTKNNKNASNGDIGFIRKIGINDNKELKVTIEFSDNRIVEYGLEEMANIELAYATTIHKAMGSEYEIVIIPVIKSHAIMLKRNLIYTAITRAKQRVILVGQKGMLYMAIHKSDTGKRNTLLGERVCKYYNALSVAGKNEIKKQVKEIHMQKNA